MVAGKGGLHLRVGAVPGQGDTVDHVEARFPAETLHLAHDLPGDAFLEQDLVESGVQCAGKVGSGLDDHPFDRRPFHDQVGEGDRVPGDLDRPTFEDPGELVIGQSRDPGGHRLHLGIRGQAPTS